MALSCLSCLLSITRCAPLDLDNVYFYLMSNVILRYVTSRYIALHSKLSVFVCVDPSGLLILSLADLYLLLSLFCLQWHAVFH